MRNLSNTNIIVDNFNFAKITKKTGYVYFLSHMHSDHYMGLSNKWDFGNIYCSKMTAILLQNLYPKLQNIIGLELGQEHKILINPSACSQTEENKLENAWSSGKNNEIDQK